MMCKHCKYIYITKNKKTPPQKKKQQTTYSLSVFLFFRYVSLIQPKQVLKEELEELRKHLEALNSPIVFCHNDPVLGNIIYNKQKGMLSHSIKSICEYPVEIKVTK